MPNKKSVRGIKKPEKVENPYLPDLAVINGIVTQTEHETLFELRFKEEKQNNEFDFKSGQFIMLSVFGVGEAPFSISSSPSKRGFLEICVRKVGKVTEVLHSMKVGEIVGVRGPYGNGFPFESMKSHDVILIAGGLGLAPLRSLIVNVHDHRSEFGKMSVLYGVKEPKELLFKEQLRYWEGRDDIDLQIIVEKADRVWSGCPIGVVTDLLKKMDIDADNTYVAICGPPIMYKFVVDFLAKCDVPMGRILVTLERRMNCGIGKCARCGIGYKFTCLDGPVFTYWDVLNLQEAI